uniref:Innexin n=1 Tax=Arion vulgaris TaxID=1028688 RepID=A0A0B7A580_9EUPU
MSMDSLIAKVTSIVLKQPIRGDDLVDRLHYFVTVAILFLFTFGAGLQEYVGKPIECWTPLDFPGGSDAYHEHINSYCWTHQLRYPQFQRNSYLSSNPSGFFYLEQPTPSADFRTAFFRWVTLVFICQACLFKIPNFIWQRLNTSAGGDLEKIRELVLQAQTAENEDNKKLKMDEVVAYFENWITGYRSYQLRLIGKHSSKVLPVLFCLGKRSGNFLSSLYLSMKICNLINVIGNIFLLSVFLDINFWRYGLAVIHSVINFGDWQDSYSFPRLLLCDFVLEGRTGENVSLATHEIYELQCTMTLNLLLEKIFVLEWFWLIFLLIITAVNLFSWGIKIKPPISTILFTKSYIKKVNSLYSIELGLASTDPISTAPSVPVCSQKEFIEDYLRSDGVCLLRMLELNTDRAVVGDVVKHLWDRYRAMHSCNVSLSEMDNINSKDSIIKTTNIDQQGFGED